VKKGLSKGLLNRLPVSRDAVMSLRGGPMILMARAICSP
jgi:hypothetical protein